MLKREIAVEGGCKGCFFYLSNPKKGEGRCSKSATPDYEDIDCVKYDVRSPSRFIHYIFKENCNEE